MSAPPAVSVRAPGRERGTRLLAALFLTPTIAGIVVFTVVPITGSIVLSFFDWNVIDPPRFAGGANYREIVGDSTVLVSFRNTLVFMVLAVALQLVIALSPASGSPPRRSWTSCGRRARSAPDRFRCRTTWRSPRATVRR